MLYTSGPNWIHGSTGNPIQRIAEQTGTQLHAWDETQAVINTDGKSLSPEEAGEYAQILWDDGMISAAFRYSEEQGSSIPSSRSLLDFFREKAEAYFTDLPADEAKRKRETLLNVASMWGAYVGSPIERQSLKFFWLEETIEGENPFVAETYHKILDHVAKPALEKARIEYECKVTGIRYGEKAASGKPTIETADGRSEQFDDVVVTTPLGWLKRNKAAFQPDLPPRLSKAIDSIGYGCLDKVSQGTHLVTTLSPLTKTPGLHNLPDRLLEHHLSQPLYRHHHPTNPPRRLPHHPQRPHQIPPPPPTPHLRRTTPLPRLHALALAHLRVHKPLPLGPTRPQPRRPPRPHRASDNPVLHLRRLLATHRVPRCHHPSRRAGQQTHRLLPALLQPPAALPPLPPRVSADGRPSDGVGERRICRLRELRELPGRAGGRGGGYRSHAGGIAGGGSVVCGGAYESVCGVGDDDGGVVEWGGGWGEHC
ncbi:hypothetical protein M8818_002415 [Zalaria obscura]|uniref:Uncharacterized protein n=1 Tax=Zalaria obscura TaxID=2024903 RepID=A0ACC3SIQ9_9PEZI